ncbi:MAG: hypothetical protein FJW64_11140 [Actinobacteria bacterium]|nr:hypothetical protein [Actinomycetota bacterium]
MTARAETTATATNTPRQPITSPKNAPSGALLVNHNIRKIAAFIDDQRKNKAKNASAEPAPLRRRDRVWANRYTRTTGNGDLTVGRKISTQAAQTAIKENMASAATHPMRT